MISFSKLIEDVYQRNAHVDDMGFNYLTLLLHCIFFSSSVFINITQFPMKFKGKKGYFSKMHLDRNYRFLLSDSIHALI